MKCKIIGLICACFLFLCNIVYIPVSAEEEPTVTESVQEVEEAGGSRGVKIASFLIIFTVAMGTTAFIVARPKLKMLKEIKNQNKK